MEGKDLAREIGHPPPSAFSSATPQALIASPRPGSSSSETGPALGYSDSPRGLNELSLSSMPTLAGGFQPFQKISTGSIGSASSLRSSGHDLPPLAAVAGASGLNPRPLGGSVAPHAKTAWPMESTLEEEEAMAGGEGGSFSRSSVTGGDGSFSRESMTGGAGASTLTQWLPRGLAQRLLLEEEELNRAGGGGGLSSSPGEGPPLSPEATSAPQRADIVSSSLTFDLPLNLSPHHPQHQEPSSPVFSPTVVPRASSYEVRFE